MSPRAFFGVSFLKSEDPARDICICPRGDAEAPADLGRYGEKPHRIEQYRGAELGKFVKPRDNSHHNSGL